MLEIPFSTGVVAAFLFLVYEIVVFPVLSYSTCALAAILIYPYARKGNQVLVQSIKFPFWSEGILRHQWSHLLLLGIRVVFVAIPVLLGAALESRPAPVPTTFRHAFFPVPKENWHSYETQLSHNVGDLRKDAEDVYRRCTWVDEYGWRRTSSANVSYGTNGRLLQVHCIESTEKKMFRRAGITDAIRNPTEHRQQIDLNISWIEGPKTAFPEVSLLVPEISLAHEENTTAMQIISITTMSAINMTCYTFPGAVEIGIGFDTALGYATGNLRCQRTRGLTVDYYMSESCDILSEFTGSNDRSSLVLKRSGIVSCWFAYIESLEFEDKIRITAEHVAGSALLRPYVGESLYENVILQRRREFHSDLTKLLYTRVDNFTLELPSNTESRTVIGYKWVIIATVHVCVVVCFGLIMFFYVRYSRQHGKVIQMPNTVNGISEIWSVATPISEHNDTPRRARITLKIRDIESEEHTEYIPTGGF